MLHLAVFFTNSVQQSIEDEPTIKKDSSYSELETLGLELTKSNDDNQAHNTEEPCNLISFETTEIPVCTEVIRQPSPPPVLAEVQDLIPAVSSQASVAESGVEVLSTDEILRAESPLQLHIVRFLKIQIV